MKKIWVLILVIICAVMPFVCTACSTGDDNEAELREVVGVAVYQNSAINEDWEMVYNNPNAINTKVFTKDGLLSYTESPPHLFYVYIKDLTAENIQSNIETNTTIDSPEIKNSKFSLKLEVYDETSEFIIYIIEKKYGKYILACVKTITGFMAVEEAFEIKLENANLDEVNLLVSRNLSTNDTYD